MNSGRGRGRPRKENKSKYPGEVTNPAELRGNNMSHMQHTQLSIKLTSDILEKENQQLKDVPFIVSGFSDSSNYTALTWYTDRPCEEDELYRVLNEANKMVIESLKDLEDNNY